MYRVNTYNGTMVLEVKEFDEWYEAQDEYYEAQDRYLENIEFDTEEYHEQHELFHFNSSIEEI